jgi:hypothetical protein
MNRKRKRVVRDRMSLEPSGWHDGAWGRHEIEFTIDMPTRTILSVRVSRSADVDPPEKMSE